MRDDDPIKLFGSTSKVQKKASAIVPLPVMFTRQELNLVLNIYGQHVALGTWRDYAIDMQKDRARFCIYQRTTEHPLYTIIKQPKLARKQGAFSVVGTNNQILKRGHELELVLRVLRPRKRPDLYIVG